MGKKVLKKIEKELVDRVEGTIKSGDDKYVLGITRGDQDKARDFIRKIKDAYSAPIEQKKIKLKLKKLYNKEQILDSKIENAEGSTKIELLEKVGKLYDEIEIAEEADRDSFFKEMNLEEHFRGQVLNMLEDESHEVAESFAKKHTWLELRTTLEAFWSEATGNR